eukprot:SAG11_NODE_4734_length_1786_cov_1.393365_1_plen_113_part_00
MVVAVVEKYGAQDVLRREESIQPKDTVLPHLDSSHWPDAWAGSSYSCSEARWSNSNMLRTSPSGTLCLVPRISVISGHHVGIFWARRQIQHPQTARADRQRLPEFSNHHVII